MSLEAFPSRELSERTQTSCSPGTRSLGTAVTSAGILCLAVPCRRLSQEGMSHRSTSSIHLLRAFLFGTSSDFFSPSNKNLTERIETSSENQVALQACWQEPLDAGYKGIPVQRVSGFPEEPPALPEPMINPCARAVQRRTCSLRTLLFASYRQHKKLPLAPAQPCLYLLTNTRQICMDSSTWFLKQVFFSYSQLERKSV